ncbi:MAG TPA: SLBB domain-containing protein [Chthonomonadales bacterium]|nr:SLBB domain-containing protein [Chthonomonadales bacterium]
MVSPIAVKSSRSGLVLTICPLILTALTQWCLPAAGQDGAPTDKPAQTVAAKPLAALGADEINPNQAIRPNFIISVSVVGESDPSGNYLVDASGNVPIKYAGITTPVSVKGLTPPAAAQAIRKFLLTYMKNPQVTVSIVNVPRAQVFVGGAVKNSGAMLINSDTTLVDVLSRAEFTENADLSQVRITHEAASGSPGTTTIVNFERYMKVTAGQQPDETQNPVLHDKDRIFVQPKLIPGPGVISVEGEVQHPQENIPLRLTPPMTVREAVNLVGGTTDLANRTAVTIRRPSLDRPLVIDLNKAEDGDPINNIELKPDDTIYVEKLASNAFINVDGGFYKPGKLVFDKQMTLTQAVFEAGGPAPYAKVTKGRIFRNPDGDPKHLKVISFNWKAIESGKEKDIQLQSGDNISIDAGAPPAHTLDFFSILGAMSSSAYLYNTVSGRYR